MPNSFEEIDDDSAEASTPISNNSGTTYDWTTAPTTTKGPPRIDLDKKTVTIIKADIILPPESEAWVKTRDGKKDTKRCQFKLFYDIDGQQEYLSGIRVFKSNDGKGYSHPSLTRDGKNQASALLKLYADAKKLNIKDVSMREFLGWLNSKPKVVIASTAFNNPTTGESTRKNIPVKIVE